MCDQEMLDAYDRALHAYEAAKVGKGDRVKAFVQFISAETALINHFGPEVLRQYRDRSLLSLPHMNGGTPASVTARAIGGRSATVTTV